MLIIIILNLLNIISFSLLARIFNCTEGQGGNNGHDAMAADPSETCNKGGLRSSLWRFGLGSFFWKLQIVGWEARDCSVRMNCLRHGKCIIGSLIYQKRENGWENFSIGCLLFCAFLLPLQGELLFGRVPKRFAGG
ncbi:MAG: hypothetical protein MUO63_04530 [Desulfobulbaceae bacterium]|nr:hypothetical protein [Desulfobulbaceae bacterium]